MDKSLCVYIRTVNFPERRIEGISNLLSGSMVDGNVNFFIDKIELNLEMKIQIQL